MPRLAAGVLLITAGVVGTPDAAYSGGYVGASYSDVELKTANVIQSVSANGSESDIRLFGGGQIGDHFALEGSHVHVSGYGSTFVYDLDLLTETASFEADYKLLTFRAIGKYPVGKFDLFAGLGLYDAEFDGQATGYETFTDGWLLKTVSLNDSGTTGIVGVEYGVLRGAFRLDFEWFDMDPGMETSIVSLGLIVRFP